MVVTGLAETIYAGNKHTFRFTVLDQDAVGSPAKNLAGMSARWALSRFKSDGTPSTLSILAKNSTSPSQITITDAANGIVEVYIAEGDTALLGGHSYYQELELYTAGAFSLVVATGTVTIERNVVNP